MQLGASIPTADLNVDPIAIRDYAQAAEGLGYDYLVAPDHVLGANPASHKGDARIGTSQSPYLDPFVLFGFLVSARRLAPMVRRLSNMSASLARGVANLSGTRCAASF